MYKYEVQDRIRNVMFVLWIMFLLGVVGFYAYFKYTQYRDAKRVEALIRADREKAAREAKIRAKQKYDVYNCMAQGSRQTEKRKEPTRQEILEAISAHISPPVYPSVKLNDSTTITIYMRQ